MAVIFLSPLIVDIRGKQADTVFSKWRGINYIRSRVVPANPKTQAQQDVRNSLKRLVELWQAAIGQYQPSWDAQAAGKEYSGFNFSISKNRVLEEDASLLLWAMASDETPMTAFGQSGGEASGVIALTFVPIEVPAGKEMHAVFRKPGLATDYKLEILPAETGSPHDVTGLTPGFEYQVYCMLTVTGAGATDVYGLSKSGMLTAGA